MAKACNLKRGNIVQIENQLYIVKHIDVKTPSARGAATLYKVRYAQVPTRQKFEQTYRGNDAIEDAELERRPVSFLYQDGDMYTFMDSENFNQYTLGKNDLEDQIMWLTDGLEGITALLKDGQIMCVELPHTVEMEIIDTPPALKGATATGRTKTAKLTTGVEIQVPEYLTVEDRVKVNTENAKFVSRA